MAKIEGMKELERMFKKLGKVPQSAATKSARAGASIVRKAARADAPVLDGYLKKGIILKRERRVRPGKAVYQITMDPVMNEIFVEESYLTGNRSYYPASQEYGYMTVDGGYVPGLRFMRDAADDNEKAVEYKVLETAAKDVDKALRKR